MGLPSSVVAKEKSVSSLLSRKPLFVMRRAPNPSSMVVVIDTALPLRSTMEMWLVPNSTPSTAPRKVFWKGGSPGLALPMDLFGSTNPRGSDIARIGQALDRHVDEGRIGEEEARSA